MHNLLFYAGNRALGSMRKILIFAIALFISTALINGAEAATDGWVMGSVIDAESGDPIIGASVMLVGTTSGAASDLDGNFMVKNIEPGTYKLMISSIGYVQTTIEEVIIYEDSPTVLNIALDPALITGKKITVTAKAMKNTEANLLRQRKKATTISDAISAEAISKSGSGDAAEAMAHVTGASVVGGKYVMVRGLGGRYGNASLDGAAMPSADPDQKAVQMDLFPTHLLDNVTVEKTFTPDKPGNFSGGSIDLRTKDMPEALSLAFSSSVSYNSNTTGNSDFLSASRGQYDWLAIDNGYRDLPDEIENAESIGYRPRSGTLDEGLAYDEVNKAFTSDFNQIKRSAPMNQSYSFSFSNNYMVGERPMGVLASLTYSHKYSYYDDGIVARYNLTEVNAPELDEEFVMPDEKGTEEVLWGGMAKTSYSLHQNHKLTAQFVYNRQGTQEARYIVGRVSGSTRGWYEERSIQYTEQHVGSFQLKGDHFVNPLNLRLNWHASLNSTSRSDPDGRYFTNGFGLDPILNAETGDTLGYDTVYTVINTGGVWNPTHIYRDISEVNREIKLDASTPLAKMNGQNLNFKFGFAYLNKERENRERRFDIYYNAPIDYDGNPDNFADPDNMGIDWENTEMDFENVEIDSLFGDIIVDSVQIAPGWWFVDTLGWDTLTWDTVSADTVYDFEYIKWIDESALTREKNNYDGTNNILGLYAMFEVPVRSYLRFVGGARYETTDMSISGPGITDEEGLIDAKDVLPSASFILAMRENMNMRLSYGRTLARPTMREKSSAYSYEFFNGLIFNGNPDLKRTLIDNYDIRWELFTGPGEILAVSGFYKYFRNPIERSLWGQNNDVRYVNVDRATVIGAEFEIRENLGRLWSKLDKFRLDGNLTLTYSKINIPDDEMISRLAFDSSASDTRALQGQSPYLVNLALSYDNYKSRTTATILLNVFGRRLSEVMRGGMPDVYEKPRTMVDFTLAQNIYRGLKFKLSAKNILNEKVTKVIDYKDVEYVFRENSTGRSLSVGLSYKL